MKDIFLDFETRSRAPLTGQKSVGAWRYSEDPSTEALCLAYSFNFEEPKLWIQGQSQPEDLRKAIQAGYRIHGWNAISFERAIFENVCKKRLGWTTPNLEQYHDTMLDALTLSLPASLEECGKALNLSTLKDDIGKKLIQLLCVPIKVGKKKGEFRERTEHLEEYSNLYYYCKQDVRAEMAIYKSLPYHLTGIERTYALITALMNERGLNIDTPAVEAILHGLDIAADELNEGFNALTGIPKLTQRAKFVSWLQLNGFPDIRNLDAMTLAEIDSSSGMPTTTRSALDFYIAGNVSSSAKYKKIKAMVCKDGTVKNNLIFNKASTGRLAGAGFQAQNLPADQAKDPEVLLDAFLYGDYDFIKLYCGSVHVAARKLVRSVIKAAPGMKFISGDLKGVEARATAWVAGEWDQLDSFSKGVDAYVISAAKMYNVTNELVSKEQRQSGKIAVLSGGFGGGWRALLKMAKQKGIAMTPDEAKKIIKDFRRGRPKLTAMWENFRVAAIEACMFGEGVYVKDTFKRFQFIREGRFLFLVLPSGRKLSFPFPEIRNEEFFGREETNLTSMWVNSVSKKWERRTVTGPSLFQSAVQGLCRDILFEAHLITEKEGYPLVLSVHDEGLSMVPDEPSFSTEFYGRIMSKTKDWAYELPIGSSCWEGYRYKKD